MVACFFRVNGSVDPGDLPALGMADTYPSICDNVFCKSHGPYVRHPASITFQGLE